MRIKFSVSWWSGNKKFFCVLFKASCALLQSHIKFNKHKGIFVHAIPVPIIVLYFQILEVIRRYSVKGCSTKYKVALKENPCAKVTFLIKLQTKNLK